MIFDFFLGINPTSSQVLNTIIQALLFEGAAFLCIPILGILIESIIVKGIRRVVATFLGPGERIFSDYILFVGVVIHELSHALFAFITGAKITEIALFKPDKDSLGHVSFRERGNKFFRALQASLSSCAPVVVGSALLLFIYFKIVPILSTNVQWGIAIYFIVAILFHMNMSDVDLKLYFKGAGPLILICIPVCIISFFLL